MAKIKKTTKKNTKLSNPASNFTETYDFLKKWQEITILFQICWLIAQKSCLDTTP